MKYARPLCAAVVMCAVLLPLPVAAKAWQFDAAQLGGDVTDNDIAVFNQGGQVPGVYHVEIWLNDEWVDTRDVLFREQEDGRGLSPCLSVSLLSGYGIKTDDYPAVSGGGRSREDGCADLGAIPAAREDFDFAGQQLLLSIPQAALRPGATDIAPETLWDDGMTALLMNYQMSASRAVSRGDGRDVSQSRYVQLAPGANLGAWRLRNSTTWQQEGGETGQWQTPYTYLERGFAGMKSRLTLGERFTPADIFDSVAFRGAMLGSDEDMVPFSQRAFSPVVRGIARTQARVEVRQHGYVVYSATVAPGAFALENLPVNGSGGDLQVTVWETDGNPQVFTVPYQTPAVALHRGYLKYNLMAGQYRPSYSGGEEPAVAQASVMYGLPWNLTLYGGLQGASYYRAVSAGMGVSAGHWGSVSLDITEERGQQAGRRWNQGGNWRLRYSKSVEATHTTLSLTHYQYASTGYDSLSGVLDTYRKGGSGALSDDADSAGKRRSRSTLTMNQPLAGLGSISLSGSRDTSQGGGKKTDSYSASYGVVVHGVSVSVNCTQSRTLIAGRWKNDRLASVVLSAPLAQWLGGSTRATWQMTAPSSGGHSQQVGLSGTAYDRQLSWNATQRRQPGTAGTYRDSNTSQLAWSGRYGQLSGSYSYSPSLRQMGLDAEGGLVITRDGLTLGQPLGDTVALAEAPGAAGVPVGGWPGVKTDFRGYTLLSDLQPYLQNVVSLDPTQLPAEAEVTQTDVTVVPTEGAVVAATFATHLGGRGLVTLSRPNGMEVPFGALVTVDKQASANSGVVDEGGLVYLSGLAEEGSLEAKWGQSRRQQCRASYRLPAEAGPAGLYRITALCR
ncbi:fimbria/pilus outer membrane usher protein [Serratia nematodiphila]